MILYFEKLDSTNAYCLREADHLASETMVVAAQQSAGRGRQGRSWHSPAGLNFYGSLILKPPFGKARFEALPQIATLAIDQAVRDFGVTASWIKWPNDVYVEDRKLAGVLAESTGKTAAKQEALVLGLGVNLNMSKAQLRAIDRPATSVLVETGREIDCRAFAEALYARLIEWYRRAQDGESETIFQAWAGNSPLLHREVTLSTGGQELRGAVRRINRNGSIEIELAGGEVKTFFAGDISLRL